MHKSQSKFQCSKIAPLCLIFIVGALQVSVLRAQVAPTEVNEEAVDEFGLERKTGRFVWSTGEIVGIGPEGARVGVAITGIRNPPNGPLIWEGMPSYPVNLNQPRITISPRPVDFPQTPGEVDPNWNYVTIDYSGGSHTFECNPTECRSQYLLSRVGLRPLGSGYEFRDEMGTLVYVENGEATITYTDGRQTVISSDGYRSNNFGFLIKASPAGSQGARFDAINQSIDYCSLAANVACTGQEERFAFVPTAAVSPLDIVDSAGGVTSLRWESKTAMEGRPPQGYPGPGYPTIPQWTSRYPLGLTLPGDSQESITISYDSHDPNLDTHDDIRVNQITRNGVTIDYQVDAYFPYGEAVEFIWPAPDSGGALSGNAISGRLAGEDWSDWIPQRNNYCSNLASGARAQNDLCSGGAAEVGGGDSGDVWTLPPPPNYAEAPPDYDEPSINEGIGSHIYELTLTASIDGEVVSVSHALRPYAREGNTRRVLLWTEDGNGRQTQYVYNRYDEVGGIRLPEGNWTINAYDLRGNISETLTYPKGAGDPPTGTPLTTTYSYEPECDDANIAWCNRPLSVTDPNGNTTNYEYNDRGQLTKEIGPAPVAGAARPTVVNEYQERTAYIKDASGNPTEAGPPISMLIRSYTCISSAVCDANTPASDKVVTEYDYGPTTGLNNLLLRGMTVTAANSSGQIETLRTCYEYNYFGERIAETQPNANLSSCQ